MAYTPEESFSKGIDRRGRSPGQTPQIRGVSLEGKSKEEIIAEVSRISGEVSDLFEEVFGEDIGDRKDEDFGMHVGTLLEGPNLALKNFLNKLRIENGMEPLPPARIAEVAQMPVRDFLDKKLQSLSNESIDSKDIPEFYKELIVVRDLLEKDHEGLGT